MKTIAIDGIDQAGKTTQVDLLKAYLEERGHIVSVMHFPNYDGPIGAIIGGYLHNLIELDPQALDLLYIADITNSKEGILNAFEEVSVSMEDGLAMETEVPADFVIFDRYVACNVAYGASRGSDFDWLIQMARYVPKPNIDILLDISLAERAKRLAGRYLDRNETDSTLLARARQNYLKYSEQQPDMFVIDGSLSIDTVHNKIVEELKSKGLI